MQEKKKRIKFIICTIIYELVLFGLVLLLAILPQNNREGMMVLSIILFCIFGIPVIVANKNLYELLNKDNRNRLKKEREELKQKNEQLRKEFDLPEYIQTMYESKLVTKPRIIMSIIILFVGIIITFGSQIIIAFMKYDNFIVEFLAIILGLIVIVFAFFVAFNKPALGIIHSVTPMVLFFALPIVLYSSNATDNGFLLAASGLVPGTIFYSLFLFFMVTLPSKRKKIVYEQYIEEFKANNIEFANYLALSHDNLVESKWFYNYLNEKRLEINKIDNVYYLIIYSNIKKGKYLLKDVPVEFEADVEVNKDIIRKIIEEKHIHFADYFANLNKGKIITCDDKIRWELDNLILDFYEGTVDHICVVRTHRHDRELTHIHVERLELEELIKEIDNPNKKVSVYKTLGGEVFDIVDINENKKNRYYSV